jgi:DnaJ family protein A protein 2
LISFARSITAANSNTAMSFRFGGLPPGFDPRMFAGGMQDDDDGEDGCDGGLYALLGVSSDADPGEIKKAYMKMCMKGDYRHPDKGGDPKQFQVLQQAYEILSDEDKRARYDTGGLAAVDGSGGGGGPGGMDAADLFGMLFGGGVPGGGAGARRGGGAAGRPGAPRPLPKGDDTVHPLRVTLEDCFRGKTLRVGVNRTIVTEDPAGQLQDRSGRRFNRRLEREDLSVSLDRGAREGQRIVFPGRGDVTPGMRPGDVVLVVTVTDHAMFKRQGADLVISREISLYEAIAGVAFSLKTLDGRNIAVRSKPGFVVKPDAVLEVEDEGMPVLGMPQLKGALYIKVRRDVFLSCRRLSYSSNRARASAPRPVLPTPTEKSEVLCYLP